MSRQRVSRKRVSTLDASNKDGVSMRTCLTISGSGVNVDVFTAAVSTGGVSRTYSDLQQESMMAVLFLYPRWQSFLADWCTGPRDKLVVHCTLLALVRRTIVARTASSLRIPFAGHWERAGSCRARVSSMAIGAVPVSSAILTVPRDKISPKYMHISRQDQDHLFLAQQLNALGMSMFISLQQNGPPLVPNHSPQAIEITIGIEEQIYVASLLQHHQGVAVHQGEYGRLLFKQQVRIHFVITSIYSSLVHSRTRTLTTMRQSRVSDFLVTCVHEPIESCKTTPLQLH